MTSRAPASASIPLSLTLNLTGVVERISPANGEPGEGTRDWVEDIAVEALLFDTYAPDDRTDTERTRGLSRRIITYDLLEGVDTASESVQRLLANILALIEDEAVDALTEEAA